MNCIVSGYVRDINDDAVYVPTLTIRLWPIHTIYTTTGKQVMPYKHEVHIDNNGYWIEELIPNSLLVPDNSRYEFEFTWREDAANPHISMYKKKVIVPDQSEVDFSELI